MSSWQMADVNYDCCSIIKRSDCDISDTTTTTIKSRVSSSRESFQHREGFHKCQYNRMISSITYQKSASENIAKINMKRKKRRKNEARCSEEDRLSSARHHRLPPLRWMSPSSVNLLLLLVFVLLLSTTGSKHVWANDSQKAASCPYPGSASNCHVTITSQAPSVPLISMDYLSDEYSNLPVGSKASYKCDDGYELFGSQVIQCLNSGKWSALAPSCALNIAYGRPTNQSSTIKGGDSRNANDGKLTTLHDTTTTKPHCTETKFEQSPWWQIDLLQAYEIRAVRILTRACCNPATQLHDLEIRVGNQSTMQGNRLCAWNPTSLEEGVTRDFTCAFPIVGRFVSIQMVGIEASLSLCEVFVFSTKEFSQDRCAVQSTLAPSTATVAGQSAGQFGSRQNTLPSSALTLSDTSNSSSPPLVVFNRTCYELQTTSGGSYLIADTYCKARGGLLLNSLNNVTHNFISLELDRAKAQMKAKLIWLGAKRDQSSSIASSSSSSSSSSSTASQQQVLKELFNALPPASSVVSATQSADTRGNSGAAPMLPEPMALLAANPAPGVLHHSAATSDVSHNLYYQASSGAGGLTSRGSQTFGLPAAGTSGLSVATPSNSGYNTATSADSQQDQNPPSSNNQFVRSSASGSPRSTIIVSQTGSASGLFQVPPALLAAASASLPQAAAPMPAVTAGDKPPVPQTTNSVSTAQTAVINPHHPVLHSPARLRNNGSGGGTSLQQQQQASVWRWAGQEPITSFMWAEEQPNNYNNQQDCIVLDGARKWLWNDVTCELNYLPWICQYKPASCGSPDRNENSTIVELAAATSLTTSAVGQETGTSSSPLAHLFQLNKVITYVCPVGHKLVGPRQRRCQSDGYWSEYAPRCQYVDCGRLSGTGTSGQSAQEPAQANSNGKLAAAADTGIDNGRIIYLNQSQTTFGSLAKYVCYEDYVLVGQDLRQCLATGLWSGKKPSCAYKWCPVLMQIPNGFLNVTSYSENSLAHYQCNRGYKLIGDDTRLCLLGGKWTNQEPYCQYVDCGPPNPISNGQFQLLNGTSTNYLSVVAYQCNQNYTLTGDNRLVCADTNQWQGKEPRCQLIECGQPEVNGGSQLLGNTFTIHSTVEYQCQKGFKQVGGDSSRTCQPDGRWSGQPIACKYVDCGRVPGILKGELQYLNGTTYLNSQVLYECTAGNRISGHRIRFCGADGRWTGVSPKCEEIRCEAPSLPENGSAIYLGNDRSLVEQSFSVGVTVQYNCDYGHIIQGPWANRQCQANGEWSGEAPTCRFVDCGQPSSVEFAQVTLKYPAANPNLVQGSRLRSQLAQDGAPLNNYELMTRAGPPTYYGCVAHYICEPNYRLSGLGIGSSAQRECLESGQWRKPAPTCEPIQCPRPDILDEHTQVEIQLVNGASMASSTTTATVGLTLNTTSQNSSTPNSNNQRALLASTQFGVQDKISYSCASGYELYGGPETRTCTHHGQWSGSSTPRCRLVDCGRPPSINPETGRYYLLNDTTTFNSIVEYTCIRPFKLIERSLTSGLARQDNNNNNNNNELTSNNNQAVAFGLKVCSQTGQWWPSDLVPKCVGSDLQEFNGGDNSVDSSNRNGQQVLAPNMAQDIFASSGGTSYRSVANNGHHHSSSSSSMLWPNLIIGFGLFIMLILIVATLVCIKTKRRSNNGLSTPNGLHQSGLAAITNNGQHHHMGVVGIVTNGTHHNGQHNDVNGHHLLNHQQQPQQHLSNGKGNVMDVSQHYINQQMMGTLHPSHQHQLYHHSHLLGTTVNGGGGGPIEVDNSLHYASSPALLGMATNTTQPLHDLPPNMRLPISGQALMNALSTQAGGGGGGAGGGGGGGGSQLGTPGSNSSSAVSMATASTGSVGTSGDDHHHQQQQQQQQMRSNRNSAMMTYSRLSIDSDGLTTGNNNNSGASNNSAGANGGHPLNTAHSIRHNPNGLITFVSPAQQQQHHHHQHHHLQTMGQASNGGGSINNSKQSSHANQISPHSAQTSLSISSASSPASSSSSSTNHHQQQQQHRERNLSNRLSNASMLAVAAASGQLQISRSQFQAPTRLQSDGSPQPPSLPAHPPPPHRLHHHQQQLMKQQQLQQNQRQQQQGTINQSSQQQQQQQHHYMEPNV